MFNKLEIIKNSTAVIFGSSGGIGNAISNILTNQVYFDNVINFHKTSSFPFDITNEKSIINVKNMLSEVKPKIRFIINATGYLHDDTFMPEKSFKNINVDYLTKCFFINTIGPALLVKHLVPILPNEEKCFFINLSARISTISHNSLGGWYGYRSSKAAANQIFKTLSVELIRKKSKILCVSVHPGTVITNLSRPFSKNNLNSITPEQSVIKILTMLSKLDQTHNGRLIDYNGNIIPF